MDIKYYDLLSTTIIGVTIVAAINYLSGKYRNRWYCISCIRLFGWIFY